MDFEEYIRQGEPQKREKEYAWHKTFKVQICQAKLSQSAKFAL